MQGFRNRYLWVGISVVAALLLFLIFWLQPEPARSSTPTVSPASRSPSPALTDPGIQAPLSAFSFSSPSQSDTQVNCQIKLDGQNNLIVNEQTRDCFEYFITQYGEKSISQIDTDFNAYLLKKYQDPALSQIKDLWTRYLKYREKLGELSPPDLKQDDPAYYRAIFTRMKNLRQQLFSAYEMAGLFGDEDIYHEYTLNRMTILDDQTLNEIEKARRLNALYEQLPESWQESLEQTTKLEELRHLTQAIKDRHGSASELRQMRLNLVGTEATGRLEALDQSRDNWKTKVNQYLGERDQILESTLSDSAKQQAINQLRQQSFDDQQQLRLQTFESVHDQGGKLPFAN